LVNPDKIEMVLFTRKRILTGMKPILFFGKELTRTYQVKHLGIILGSKLTWKEHLQHKCKKAVTLLKSSSTILAMSPYSGKDLGNYPKDITLYLYHNY